MSNVSIDAALEAATRGKSLEEIAQAAGVSFGHWCAMLRENRTLAQAYADAKEIGFDVLADQLMRIPIEQEDVNRARLMSDNIKWLLSKRASGKYGDKLSIDVSGQVDLTAIMADSAKRLRPMRDLDIADAQLVPIESSACDARPTDNVSAAAVPSLQDLLE